MVRLRGSGIVDISWSSPLNGVRFLGVGIPGAFVTAAIVCRADADVDFETGRGDFCAGFIEFEEEKERRCWNCEPGWLC